MIDFFKECILAKKKDKHPGGRPLAFKTVTELQEKIDYYFDECKRMLKPYTVSGLASYLKIDRRTLINYSEKEEFFPTIKNAKVKIEAYAAEQLFRTNGQVAGIIFNLKNNYDWTDKQEHEHTIKDYSKMSKKLRDLL